MVFLSEWGPGDFQEMLLGILPAVCVVVFYGLQGLGFGIWVESLPRTARFFKRHRGLFLGWRLRVYVVSALLIPNPTSWNLSS